MGKKLPVSMRGFIRYSRDPRRGRSHAEITGGYRDGVFEEHIQGEGPKNILEKRSPAEEYAEGRTEVGDN